MPLSRKSLQIEGGGLQSNSDEVENKLKNIISAVKPSEQDLTKVEYIKHIDNGKCSPVLIKNDFEEGTGHHSIIKYKGEYYAIYHGHDYKETSSDDY